MYKQPDINSMAASTMGEGFLELIHVGFLVINTVGHVWCLDSISTCVLVENGLLGHLCQCK